MRATNLRAVLVCLVCVCLVACSRFPSRSEVSTLLQKYLSTQKANARPRAVVTVKWEDAIRAKVVGRQRGYYVAVNKQPLADPVLASETDQGQMSAIMSLRALAGVPMGSLGEAKAGATEGEVALFVEAIEVTTIAVGRDATSGKVPVEFSWKPRLPAGLEDCKCVTVPSSAHPARATVTRFDDGWRVTDVQW